MKYQNVETQAADIESHTKLKKMTWSYIWKDFAISATSFLVAMGYFFSSVDLGDGHLVYINYINGLQAKYLLLLEILQYISQW